MSPVDYAAPFVDPEGAADLDTREPEQCEDWPGLELLEDEDEDRDAADYEPRGWEPQWER